jgi:molybdopterin/thiamine biosynthesis adenylyltransferase
VNGTDPLERYSRQVLLPQLRRQGQEKLAGSRVGLVGCGALGSFVASHLARSGIGYLRLIDRDYPELHNLHRHALCTEEDVERHIPKAEAAAEHLRKANSAVEIEARVGEIDSGNVGDFAADLDLVVDGTDNFAARFAINQHMVEQGRPWIYGGVVGSSGMCMTIVPGEGPCLRCLVRELPTREQAPTADVAGVLGTVVGVIGSIEATEAIKLLVEPEARNRRLLVMDVWDLTFDRLEVPRDPACPCCGGDREVPSP